MVKRLSVFSFDDHTAILSGFLAFQPYFLPGSKFYLPQQREVAVLDYREIGRLYVGAFLHARDILFDSVLGE